MTLSVSPPGHGISIFPGGVDQIVDNVTNASQQANLHPNLHNQLADGLIAVQTELLTGGSLSLQDHVAAADPHPVYLTQAEGDARYTPGALTQAQADSRYLQLAGGILTGPVTLSGPPTNNLHAATKAYVDTNSISQTAADARYLQLSGGTLVGNLLFSTDNTRDIGALGANRPRDVNVGRNLTVGGQATFSATIWFAPDNLLDIGVSGSNRPRTIYAATSIVSPIANHTSLFLGAQQANAAYIRAASFGVLVFGSNGLDRWQIDGSGYFIASTDNTYDIGQSGASRPRNIYVGTQVNANQGFVTGGTNYSDQFVTSNSNTFAVRNGTTAQAFFVYNTWTDLNNYERITVAGAGTDMRIAYQVLGTGAVKPFRIFNGTAGNLALGESASDRWFLQGGAGHFLAISDNTYDIGASAGNRPRNIYAGTSFVGPGAIPAGGTAGQVLAKNTGTNYDLVWVTPSAGGGGGVTLPLSQSLTFFPDNTFDIGASGTSRPRDVWIGRNLDVVGAATYGNTLSVNSQGGFGSSATNSAGLLVSFGGAWSTSSWQYGLMSQMVFSTSATLGYAIYGRSGTQAGAWTLGTSYAFYADTAYIGPSSAITTSYGVYVANQGGAGITNAYGVYIAAQSGATTANMGLYNAGTSQLMGGVGIGTTPPVSSGLNMSGQIYILASGGGALSIGSQQLNVANAILVTTSLNISRTTSSGASISPTFGQFVTNAAYVYWGQYVSQAASFTTPTGAGFYLAASSIGSGNTVTNLYGMYIANQGASGVTNVYGLYIVAQTGAATNNVGLYNAGTTWLGGPTGIGNFFSPQPSTLLYLCTAVPANLTSAAQYGINFSIGWNAPTSYAACIATFAQMGGTVATLANAYQLDVGYTAPNGWTITNSYGLRVQNQGQAGIVNAYGVYIAAQSGATTTNVSLFVGGRLQLAEVYTTSATAGAASALPATPALYFYVTDYTGTVRKIPAYNV